MSSKPKSDPKAAPAAKKPASTGKPKAGAASGTKSIGYMRTPNLITPDLLWQVVRNNSSFLRKQRGMTKTFTAEPLNLKGVNSFRYNGYIQKKGLGIEADKDGKGVVLVYKKRHGQNKVKTALNRVALRKDPRRTMRSVSGFMRKGHYKAPLNKLAARRASRILQSQKAVTMRKRRTGRKKTATKA